MIPKNILNIVISFAAILTIAFITFKYCGKEYAYSKKYVDAILNEQAATKAAYIDTLNLVRGQLDLKEERVLAQTDKVVRLENYIDTLVRKHEITKQKLKKYDGTILNNDTGFVLAPNEYVAECEECFHTLTTYKTENKQLRFERDGYDTLMRSQNSINESRVAELEAEKLRFNKLFNDCAMKAYKEPEKNTRKLKLSGAGMLNADFLPRAGGFGLIYEDRQFNEYGGHVLFGNGGQIYMVHIAKTISLKRKK